MSMSKNQYLIINLKYFNSNFDWKKHLLKNKKNNYYMKNKENIK